MRQFLWRDDDQTLGKVAKYSIAADPVPQPPFGEGRFEVELRTIAEHPNLFKIVTPINVDALEALLINHPNRPFVDSVMWSMRNGFWPWANPGTGEYPTTWDNSVRPVKSNDQAAFIAAQFKTESEKG